MKYKTAELEGAMLDAAVALALGWPLLDGDTALGGPLAKLSPSADWALGGPIIERENISVYEEQGAWFAGYFLTAEGGDGHYEWPRLEFRFGSSSGSRPLVAAMRAFVRSALGEEVELP